MGRSAKVHKRTVRPPQKPPYRSQIKQSCSPFSIHPFQLVLYLLQKKNTSNASAGTSTPLTTPTPGASIVRAAAAASAAVASAAKKAKLNLKGNKNKNKRAKLRSSTAGATGGHDVLGGADYVDIMMGSRRREREEAMKLP
jgi:hypothetical protein